MTSSLPTPHLLCVRPVPPHWLHCMSASTRFPPTRHVADIYERARCSPSHVQNPAPTTAHPIFHGYILNLVPGFFASVPSIRIRWLCSCTPLFNRLLYSDVELRTVDVVQVGRWRRQVPSRLGFSPPPRFQQCDIGLLTTYQTALDPITARCGRVTRSPSGRLLVSRVLGSSPVPAVVVPTPPPPFFSFSPAIRGVAISSSAGGQWALR